jgi:hypothetical protein
LFVRVNNDAGVALGGFDREIVRSFVVVVGVGVTVSDRAGGC